MKWSGNSFGPVYICCSLKNDTYFYFYKSSVRYRKILKKERQKKEEKELSDALKANPDVAG